jgi:signal transduction histidine kinase/CheY-like chemotaxis protein
MPVRLCHRSSPRGHDHPTSPCTIPPGRTKGDFHRAPPEDSPVSSPSLEPEPPSPAPNAGWVAGFHLLDVPVAWADARGQLLGANAAFAAALGLAVPEMKGRCIAELLGLQTPATTLSPTNGPAVLALAARLAHDEPFAPMPLASRRADGQPLRGWLGQCRADALRILSLQLARPDEDWAPAPALSSALASPAPNTGAAALPPAAELLAMAQALGRFGVWQRDLRTGDSHWDDQVWQFFGLAPQPQAVSLDRMLLSVHADDRELAVGSFQASLQQLGRHTHRYRLRGADGQYRPVRSIWEVRAGADGLPATVWGILLDDAEAVQLAQAFDDTTARLDLAISLAGVAIWQHDRATGQVHGNDLGWSLLGLPPQPQGRPAASLAALLHPDDLATLRQQLRLEVQARPPSDLSASEGSIDLGARWRHADGPWRYLLTRRVPRRDAQGELIGHVGVALDLTERFDQQQQALALAQRLEMATAAAGVGVWNVQLSDPPAVHWDDQMRLLHGQGPDYPAPPITDYLRHHVHPDDRDNVSNSLTLLLRRREGLLDMDLRVVCPDGQVRRLATRSSISGDEGQRTLHGVMLDVTERHATEERLRQAHERAALAARGAGIGTWESDAEALYGWWDEQMFRLRGREPRITPVPVAEMVDWLHPADRDSQMRHQQAAVAADRATNQEFRVVWPDGTVRWLASRSTPVRDESGRTVRRIGINWDVTDAREAAASRQERLLAQRESQAKSRFLARISHELRTPLNAVLGFSQLLLADTAPGQPPDPSTWRRRVEHVQASGEHLLALIDDVLELSSLESGELPLSLQPVALAPLAETTLPLVELLAQEHGVTLQLGALDGWALADPVRLRQVLLNLLSNAIKYNRRGGRVTVDTETQAGWQLLRVQDTGRGLSEDQLRHLFEPFNRLGADHEGIAGTGIGLAIVQASMQHMGGSVAVSSRLGAGSCFELSLQRTLPPLPVPPGLVADSGTRSPPPLPPGGRLLYIEDNEVNLLIVSELMRQRADLQFLSAVDGASGLAAAREQQPVLILLDMQLPDMDGHEVLRRLRADPATAAIRCIALSANAMPEDIRHALANGFDDYWTKPLDLQAFLRSIDALFGRPAAPAARA